MCFEENTFQICGNFHRTISHQKDAIEKMKTQSRLFFLHIVFILHVKLIFHQNFPEALTTTSTINRNVFFPYAKLQKLEKKGQNCPK